MFSLSEPVIRNSLNQPQDLEQDEYLCKQHHQICIGANLNPNTELDKILVCAICLQEAQHNIQFVTLQEAQNQVYQMKRKIKAQKQYQIEFKKNTLIKLQDQLDQYLKMSQGLLNKLLHICNDLILKLDEQIDSPLKNITFIEAISMLSQKDQGSQDQDNIFNFYTQFMGLADIIQIDDYQKNYLETVENILIDISQNTKQNIIINNTIQKIKLKCLFHNDQQIQMLDLNPDTQKKSRLLCIDCPPTNHTSLNKSQIQWQLLQEKKNIMLGEYLKELNESRMKANFQLRQFRNSADEISNKISLYLNNVYFRALWEIGEMRENMEKSYELISHQELQEIAEILSSYENQQSYVQNWINQHKKCSVKQFSKEISVQLNTLFSNLQSCYKTLKHYFLKDYQDIIKQNKIQSILYQEDKCPSSIIQGPLQKPFVDYQLLSTTQEKKIVYSMVFNKKQDLFIASFGQVIKVFGFKDAQFQFRQNLNLENSMILNLFYSEDAEIFYSGTQYGFIVQWMLNKDNQFIQVNQINDHKVSNSSCLVSLNSDTQLIVGSENLTIWREIKSENKWDLDYILNKHDQAIISICLNVSKNQFLSTGKDKKIILWQKGEDNIFKFQQIIETKQLYQQVCFIDDQCFACQSVEENDLTFYQIDDDKKLFILKDYIIPLRCSTLKLENQKLIFINSKQLLVTSNGHSITILQKGEFYNFRINKVIEFRQAQLVLFALCSDGSYLITWDDASMTFASRCLIEKQSLIIKS